MRLVAMCFLGLLAGCDLPRDPDESLERIRGGTLRAGITDAEPWINVPDQGEPSGVEAELIAGFAAAHSARIEWRRGSSEELLAALEEGSVDLVAGGLDEKSPWKTRVALTRPYFTEKAFVGFPPGRPQQETLDGVEVAVEKESWIIPLLKKKDAVPVPLDDPFRSAMPVAAAEWKLGANGYRAGEKELGEHKHVMAVPAGENALLVALEEFLEQQKSSISARLVREEARP